MNARIVSALRRFGVFAGLAILALAAAVPAAANTDAPVQPPLDAPGAAGAFELPDEAMPADSDADLSIVFRPINVVDGAEYSLGDLASVSARDADRERRLETLILGKSPTLGRRLLLNPQQIAMDLARVGITEDDARIEVPDRVIVEREVQDVDLAPFEEIIRDEVTNRVGDDAKDGSLVLRDLTLSGAASLPAGAVSHELSLRMPSKPTGSVSYVLQLLVDGNVEERVHGNFLLDREVDVYEASRGMARGDGLQPAALRPARRLLSEIRGVPLAGSDLADALSIKRNLEEGDVLTWINVERQTLIRRGQTVRMVLESPSGLQIATVGRAEDNGCLGDLIGVMNLTSRRVVRGIVLNQQTVRVPF